MCTEQQCFLVKFICVWLRCVSVRCYIDYIKRLLFACQKGHDARDHLLVTGLDTENCSQSEFVGAFLNGRPLVTYLWQQECYGVAHGDVHGPT